MEEDYLKKLAEGCRFFSVLSDDVNNANKLLFENDSQFTRRIYLRALFAFIEGNSFRLRQMALAAHKHRIHCFSNEEILMLEDKDLSIKDNGDIKIKTKYIDLMSNIRFSQKSFIKATGGKQPDFSDIGWAQLREAIAIRNRITHPRSKEDLNIKDDELAAIQQAKEWYSNNIQYLP